MTRWTWIFLSWWVLFAMGWLSGYNAHPYEKCSRDYVGDDNIGECVWLKLKGH